VKKITYNGGVNRVVRIEICIGSACYLRGANKVLHTLTTLLDKQGITHEVDLRGDFCQGECTEGVILRINGELIKNVQPDGVYQLFVNKILGNVQ
jgi:NADH-quinone oxidoreductase subunit G